MIPSADQLVATHAFLARRYGLRPHASEKGLQAAVELARTLAGTPRDEPAAIFFALSLYARSLGALWPLQPRLEADGVARGLGLALVATDEELRLLRLDIASQKRGFDEVRAFFDERLREAESP